MCSPAVPCEMIKEKVKNSKEQKAVVRRIMGIEEEEEEKKGSSSIVGKHKQRREKKRKSKCDEGIKKTKKLHDNYYCYCCIQSKSKSTSTSTSTRELFGVLLAALSRTNTNKIQYPSSNLIKLCLNKAGLLLSENSQTSTTAPALLPIIALLPPILFSRCAEVVRCGAEFIGTASLFSYELNQLIASDSRTLLALISALRTNAHSAATLLAVCNAVLDLSTTHLGRRNFVHYSALDALMLRFLELPKAFDNCVLLCGNGEDFAQARIAIMENELPLLLLNAALLLLGSCDIQHLRVIPVKLFGGFFSYLNVVWEKVRHQMFVGRSSQCDQPLKSYSTSMRISTIAENIFRLSTVHSDLSRILPCKTVINGIFGSDSSRYRDFMLNHWETSPVVIDRVSRLSTLEDDIFNPFLQSFNSNPGDPSFILTMLQGMVSCVPISSDELDIFSFLNEYGGRLGCPLIYQQDIRVLKTQKKSQSELHYFQQTSGDSLVKTPIYLNHDNIIKCEEAFKDGFTIALRGMEFRLKSIASIANALAAVFGQPSAGANLYLTPPSSQGLARHYDDHCVFVCQLFGTKSWKLWNKPLRRLPRLYEPLDGSYSVASETSTSESKQVLLREGDILYIPRGVPHEACTHNGKVGESSGYSLHLTLGIEVEPPFEWEGFAHVALHCWIVSQKKSDYDAADSLPAILGIIAVNLLHVVINFMGESDLIFRKACLIAATLPSDANNWLQPSQKILFSHMMEKINSISSFSDVVSALKLSIQKKENPLYQIRWLERLHSELENPTECYCTALMSTEKLLDVCSEHEYKAETIFLQTKSDFCKVMLFDYAIDKYKFLVERYQKVRKQYMSGMLSLHRK